MANRAKKANMYNRRRQLWYLSQGVVMLPKKAEMIRQVLKKNGVAAT